MCDVSCGHNGNARCDDFRLIVEKMKNLEMINGDLEFDHLSINGASEVSY